MDIKTSIILSYKEENQRDKINLKKLLDYLSWILNVQTELIIVEQGSVSKIDWLDEVKKNQFIRHIFIKNDLLFNKGWGYNIGVKEAKGDYIIIHDINSYLKLQSYNSCVHLLNRFDIVNPYKRLYNLNEQDSDKFFSINYNFNVAINKKPNNVNDISDSIFMIRKDKYLYLKGFSETFNSHYYQKLAFDSKINKLDISVNYVNDVMLQIYEEKVEYITNDKYLYYLYNDLEVDELIELLDNISMGLKDEISIFDYDSFFVTKPISIIVTAYQTQDYIEECLDSIENQTYFEGNDNFEVLVGVDNCQDTLDKLLEIRHKYRNLRIFMMKKNKGTYITSNTLIDNTKYENILRFDSDDIMMPNMIKEIMLYVNDSYNLIRFRFTDLKDGVLKEYTNKIFAHGVLLYKKYLFEDLGGYQPWKCAADSELIKRGEPLFRTKLVDKSLFYRRVHNNSLTIRDDVGMESDLRKEYHSLIGTHKNIKINKIVNEYREY